MFIFRLELNNIHSELMMREFAGSLIVPFTTITLYYGSETTRWSTFFLLFWTGCIILCYPSLHPSNGVHFISVIKVLVRYILSFFSRISPTRKKNTGSYMLIMMIKSKLASYYNVTYEYFKSCHIMLSRLTKIIRFEL